MSIIDARCLAGLTPTRCNASPRAPPTPGRSSLPTSRMKNGPFGVPAARFAPLSGAIFATRRYVGPGCERHVISRHPRRDDAAAREDERGDERADGEQRVPNAAMALHDFHGVVPDPVRAVVVVLATAVLRVATTRYAVTRQCFPFGTNVSSTLRVTLSGPDAVVTFSSIREVRCEEHQRTGTVDESRDGDGRRLRRILVGLSDGYLGECAAVDRRCCGADRRFEQRGVARRDGAAVERSVHAGVDVLLRRREHAPCAFPCSAGAAGRPIRCAPCRSSAPEPSSSSAARSLIRMRAVSNCRPSTKRTENSERDDHQDGHCGNGRARHSGTGGGRHGDNKLAIPVA